jgi:DNA-binding NarL/FixJ family response regulator
MGMTRQEPVARQVEAAARSHAREVAFEALRQLAERTAASGRDWALGIEARSRAPLSEGEVAEAFAERAKRELRATGETARRRHDETRGELTAWELQIARLREGLTNPEIGARLLISPRTVEWHLRNVYTKARHQPPQRALHGTTGQRAGAFPGRGRAMGPQRRPQTVSGR